MSTPHTGPAYEPKAFAQFMPIAKVDKEKQMVWGYASTPTEDSDGEVITLKAIKAALPGYMSFANIREMHRLSAVGVTKEAAVDQRGLYIGARITDPVAWEKCKDGVYKGFSIGGQKLAKTGNIITELELSEISLVDRPANPDCKIDVVKSAKPVAECGIELLKVRQRTKSPAAKLLKAAAALISEGSEPEPVIEVETKPEPPAALAKAYKIETEGDIRAAWAFINKGKTAKAFEAEALAAAKEEISKAWAAKVGAELPAPEHAKAVFKAWEAEQLQKAEQARQAETQQALELVPVTKVKVPRGAELGTANDPEEPTWLNLGKASKSGKSGLAKGMSVAGSLSYAFDSIRGAQRSLIMEGRDEGDDNKDKALAKELGSAAQILASVISQKATHEGGEALDFSDVDDKYIQQYLGKAFKMTTADDALGNALLGLLAKAAKPSALDCIGKAKESLKEARKARKGAMAELEKAHGMAKANYLAKANKGKDKAGDDDGFDAEECMKAISKAHAAFQQAEGLTKTAKAYLAKAESAVGQSGEQATDGNEHYQVPAGVKHLGQDALVTASPGGGASGGRPPMYPDDGSVYPGKASRLSNLQKMAKDGMVSLPVVEAYMEAERLAAENEVLKSLPQQGGQRPYSFNMTKAFGGQGTQQQGKPGMEAIFKGVDVNDLNSQDESRRNTAVAKAAGNYLMHPGFGASLFDPTFKGTAGLKQ